MEKSAQTSELEQMSRPIGASQNSMHEEISA
jgi:hypothetical protein